MWSRVNSAPNGSSSSSLRKPTVDAAEARMRERVSFDFAFALVFLAVLHGFSAAKILLILAINHKIATKLPRRHVPVATWVFNICLLLANEIYDGYKFRNMALFLTGAPQPLESLVSEPPFLLALGEWLDNHGGLMSRWEILFNITVLRMISFNLDYYWSLDQRSGSSIEV